ncbi:MAG: 30S ribosomal protein S19e [Candidatus Undinarchaeales archaeon]|jgi:small subunit ribosomal protein S19e|nr:30S ribosomal protein S19e [Candidatus Undinarchaeales archaeon]MDP7491577.1 30S ribosomal protein S19e [Candidatus Undinarchaeales archaeon]
MVTVYDVPAAGLTLKLSQELKKDKNIVAPPWAAFVKTGSHKTRRPEQENWWQIRAASILRRIYIDGPVGVERLRTFYGGRKNRGMKPERFQKAGGKILRNILQQLEGSGYVKVKKGSGRIVSPKGQKFLDSLALKVSKGG